MEQAPAPTPRTCDDPINVLVFVVLDVCSGRLDECPSGLTLVESEYSDSASGLTLVKSESSDSASGG